MFATEIMKKNIFDFIATMAFMYDEDVDDVVDFIRDMDFPTMFQSFRKSAVPIYRHNAGNFDEDLPVYYGEKLFAQNGTMICRDVDFSYGVDDLYECRRYWDHTKTFRFYHLNGSSVEFLFYLDYDQRTDRWCRNSTDWDRELASPITEQDAQEIINGYSRINMKMVPLMEFIVDTDGTTLRQVIEAGALHVSEVEILRIYADYIKEYNATGYDRSCKYYCLKDVNNDAITDLIFSDNTDEFHHIVTVYNGELRLIVSQDHIFLCEGGILLSNFRQFNGDGTQTTTYNWYKLDCTMPNGGRVLISSVKYNPQEPAWYFDEDANGYYEKIISQSEYDAVIDSYLRIELDMKPIAEFPGQ